MGRGPSAPVSRRAPYRRVERGSRVVPAFLRGIPLLRLLEVSKGEEVIEAVVAVALHDAPPLWTPESGYQNGYILPYSIAGIPAGTVTPPNCRMKRTAPASWSAVAPGVGPT